LDSNNKIHNEEFGVNFLQDSNNAFIFESIKLSNPSKGYAKGGS
jgi:hypothetical protein